MNTETEDERGITAGRTGMRQLAGAGARMRKSSSLGHHCGPLQPTERWLRCGSMDGLHPSRRALPAFERRCHAPPFGRAGRTASIPATARTMDTNGAWARGVGSDGGPRWRASTRRADEDGMGLDDARQPRPRNVVVHARHAVAPVTPPGGAGGSVDERTRTVGASTVTAERGSRSRCACWWVGASLRGCGATFGWAWRRSP